MSFIKIVRKFYALIFTLLGAIVSYLLLNRKDKEKKGGEIDREKIREDAKKRIMDTPDPDFYQAVPICWRCRKAGER